MISFISILKILIPVLNYILWGLKFCKFHGQFYLMKLKPTNEMHEVPINVQKTYPCNYTSMKL